MCIKEYDEEETFNIIRAECESRGRAEGKTEGVIETLVGFLKEGLISEKKAADRAGMSLENFIKAVELYCTKD